MEWQPFICIQIWDVYEETKENVRSVFLMAGTLKVMRRYVVWYKFTDISKKRAVSTFRAEQLIFVLIN
jgi:hypothetical protein